MKKVFSFLAISLLLASAAVAQTGAVRSPAFGISYIRTDFVTPKRIRSNSLSAAIRDKQFLTSEKMRGGFALSYFKGVVPHIDFVATLAGSSTQEALPGKTFDESKFFLEADASANFKMFTDNYRFTPYLIAGVGASRYRSYFGAFVPLGGGLRYNFKNTTSIFATLQYRVPVTEETAGYHFFTSIGVSGVLGKKK